ncbi:antibiotic biosynthesis monooxygenase [Micromonospora sp. STR1s_5]|nr:antibiotic biosynthesis monooxygenase [Micromonospora sp. STR1s_5]
MIFEVARIDVKPGQESTFEERVSQAVALFERAKGCRSLTLQRSIESPSSYRLVVGWETVEDHTVGFRQSHDYQTWRSLVGEFFARPPEVEHVAEAVKGFGATS